MRALMPAGSAPSLRANFARCAIDLALEHHSALIRVVAAGEYGTGGALLRPVLEASTAACWFVYSAKCSEIQALPTAATENVTADIPGLADMLKTLIPVFPAIQSIADGLKSGGTAKWLHKYTHGGLPQLTRRVGNRWVESDVIMTLIRADVFSVIAASLETVIAKSEAIGAYCFGTRDDLGVELHEKFGRDLPPQLPHSLPPAPLLEDRYGPPFA
jgi:hypothetical protein